MNRIIVIGIGTDVGKTVVSAILAQMLDADYWKPIECGDSDSKLLSRLIDRNQQIHTPSYSLKAPLSPHHAARLEGITIKKKTIILPKTKRSLIIESVGGIFVPLTETLLSIDLFKRWKAKWVLVSKHYLGSINHTLLTLNALKNLNIVIDSLIFNGVPNPDSESIILKKAKPLFFERLLLEPTINLETINKYGKKWAHNFKR